MIIDKKEFKTYISNKMTDSDISETVNFLGFKTQGSK